MSSKNKESAISRLKQNICSNDFRDEVICNKKFKEISKKRLVFIVDIKTINFKLIS